MRFVLDNKHLSNLWESFEKTGSVADYLAYKSAASDNDLFMQSKRCENFAEDFGFGKIGNSDQRLDNQGTKG